MRITTKAHLPTRLPTRLPTCLRGVAAGTAAAALALSLAPGAAVAQDQAAGTVDRSSRAHPRVSVRLKVATRPVTEVAVTARAWPGRLIESQGFAVDANDLVEVRRDGHEVTGAARRLRHGDIVRLVDVEKHRRTTTTPVHAAVVEVPTTKLAPGRRKVLSQGRAGVRRVVTVRTFHNGEPVRRRVVARAITREPRPRRVLVGRREPSSVAGADGLDWAALAGCESGGNPRAVNQAGYYGLYQFDVGTWRGVGGSGLPNQASAGEQTYRAKLLYASRGRSPWPTCGRLL